LKNKLLIIGLAIVIALPAILMAQAGSSSFVFLRVGGGSRPIALSEAVTASGTDITTAFYNPAALMSFDNQISLMYNQYFKDVSQGFLAAGFKKADYAIGGYISTGTVDDFERRGDVPTPDPLGKFSEDNFYMAMIYSRQIQQIKLGLALKYAYENIDYGSANAFMVDLGAQMPVYKEITAGISFKHLGTKPKFLAKSYSLPKEYRFGLSYRPKALKEKVEILADGIVFQDSRPKYNFGLEYTDLKVFAVRAGYGIPYDSRGLTLGGGLFYRQFRFDYAFVPYKNDLGNTHRFTLTAAF
jgi:hypothetical protein